MSDFLETEAYVTCTNTGCKKNVLVSRILHIQASGKYTKVFLTGAEEYVFSDLSIGSWKQELKAGSFFMSAELFYQFCPSESVGFFVGRRYKNAENSGGFLFCTRMCVIGG